MNNLDRSYATFATNLKYKNLIFQTLKYMWVFTVPYYDIIHYF